MGNLDLGHRFTDGRSRDTHRPGRERRARVERPLRSPASLLRVGISDFDVAPSAGSRFGVVVLGVASAVAGVLAIIGWPLPVISSTHGRGQHAWACTVREVQDWFAHDGWRMSGASWIYGALAVVAVAAAVILLHPAWSGRRADHRRSGRGAPRVGPRAPVGSRAAMVELRKRIGRRDGHRHRRHGRLRRRAHGGPSSPAAKSPPRRRGARPLRRPRSEPTATAPARTPNRPCWLPQDR